MTVGCLLKKTFTGILLPALRSPTISTLGTRHLKFYTQFNELIIHSISASIISTNYILQPPYHDRQFSFPYVTVLIGFHCKPFSSQINLNIIHCTFHFNTCQTFSTTDSLLTIVDGHVNQHESKY